MDSGTTTSKQVEGQQTTSWVIPPQIFSTSSFDAIAPLGDSDATNIPGTDCDTCCPGKCTGCTQCNKCNLLF